MSEAKKTHKSVYVALVAAQANMTAAFKTTKNEHFKSKYADLSSVKDACFDALNAEGIAIIQPVIETEHGRFVSTVFYHAETDTKIECNVPLIVSKNDMQGFGSAVTYARRYGLMSLAGIAPEDDDGNAAASAAPTQTKSSASLKRDGEWERVKADLDQDMADCNSLVSLEKLKDHYRKRLFEGGWPSAWKAALKDIFDAKEDDLKAAADHPLNAG